MNKYRTSNKKTGFTLIELLVVISIIAVLMAIMMPALGKARESAKTTICQSNNRQIAQAVSMYANASDRRVPPCRPGHPSAGPKHPWSNKHAVEWYYLVLQTAGAFNPSDYDKVYTDQKFKFDSFAHCPSWNPPAESEVWDWGYGMNTQLLSYDKRKLSELDPTGTTTAAMISFLKAPRIENIPQPASMVYSGDSPHYWFVQSSMSWITNKDEFLSSLTDSSYSRPANKNIKWTDVRNIQWSMCDPYRHGGHASYSFIDGHAEKLKANQDTYDMLKKRWDRLN